MKIAVSLGADYVATGHYCRKNTIEVDGKEVHQLLAGNDEYKDQIYIYKVNTEEEQELAAAFGIRSIPSLLFIPMGENPQMAMGAMSKSGFKEAIDKVLLKK
jgi:thioredoxin-like negative regulator of GroEL